MWGTFLLLIVAAVVWYILNRTSYGRHVYATGDDPEAARLAGIDTDRVLLSVYVFAGLIAAIAGWALIGRVGAISPTAGENANLDSITAVVIGGTSLFGGRGSIIGTLVGALIVGVFRSAVSLAGLDVLWQEFAIGVLIIVAVALDQWIRRVVEVTINPNVEPILSCRQLVKRYGRVTALDHADFDLYPNEIQAVIGDNGAGKSSLIKAICGAVIPDAGEIRLGGEDRAFPLADRRARSGHRDRLPKPRAVARALDRRQHVPRPRDQGQGLSGPIFPAARPFGACRNSRAKS